MARCCAYLEMMAFALRGRLQRAGVAVLIGCLVWTLFHVHPCLAGQSETANNNGSANGPVAPSDVPKKARSVHKPGRDVRPVRILVLPTRTAASGEQVASLLKPSWLDRLRKGLNQRPRWQILVESDARAILEAGLRATSAKPSPRSSDVQHAALAQWLKRLDRQLPSAPPKRNQERDQERNHGRNRGRSSSPAFTSSRSRR